MREIDGRNVLNLKKKNKPERTAGAQKDVSGTRFKRKEGCINFFMSRGSV